MWTNCVGNMSFMCAKLLIDVHVPETIFYSSMTSSFHDTYLWIHYGNALQSTLTVHQFDCSSTCYV